jgi:chemotaxis protein methyltransferase CheR
MLTSEQFKRTRRLARDIAGIELVERHRALLFRRGQRLGLRLGGEFDSFLDAAEAGDYDAGRLLVRLITTKFTGFFRHPSQFEAAAKTAARAVHLYGRARLWSAATATGEEAYSLAMTLVECFHGDNPPVTILATDLDHAALTCAQRGEYGSTAIKGLNDSRLARFFTETVPRRWIVNSFIRQLVEFRALNLANLEWPVEGCFDVIFCRNVLMYFEERRRSAVLERMASLLTPGGILILDPSEHLGGASPLFIPQQDAIYCANTAPVGPMVSPSRLSRDQGA